MTEEDGCWLENRISTKGRDQEVDQLVWRGMDLNSG